MNIAFYAPMKSPHHPRPSGDRRIARLLIQALETHGHRVEVMSGLRAWEGKGNQPAQQDICIQGRNTAEQIIKDIQARTDNQKPEVWFSYHLYHKAPDWIGPRVAETLDIPYVVVEASLAMKQLHGDWATGLLQVMHALKLATAIICLNPDDVPALKLHADARAKLYRIPPFLDISEIRLEQKQENRAKLALRYNLDPKLPWIISVAMMRDDAKLKSYQYLAQTLEQLTLPFELLLVGDGKARHKVEALFTGKLAGHAHYTGELDQKAMLEILSAGNLFVWPAVNEAIGMAILEAQASGLPVVAGASGAIPDIVQQGETGFLHAPDDTQKMATSIDHLLRDPKLRKQFSLAAIKHTEQHHSLQATADSLNDILQNLPQTS